MKTGRIETDRFSGSRKKFTHDDDVHGNDLMQYTDGSEMICGIVDANDPLPREDRMKHDGNELLTNTLNDGGQTEQALEMQDFGTNASSQWNDYEQSRSEQSILHHRKRRFHVFKPISNWI